MDWVQIVLAAAIAVLTVVLALVGFEVFQVFRELRQSMKRFNGILDDAALVSNSVAKQVSNFSELLNSAKMTLDLAKGLFKKEKKEGLPEEKKGEEKLLLKEGVKEESVKNEESPDQPSGRRFFTRSGKKL